MEILNEMFNNLKKGGTYGHMVTNVRYPYFHENIWNNGKFFCWNHYGSSANRATKEELEWLITTIFKCEPEEFVQKYELRF